MAPTRDPPIEIEQSHDFYAHLSEAEASTKNHKLVSNGHTAYHDVVEIENIRSHFPGVGGVTVPFNNAAGTLVLNEAIERFNHHLKLNNWFLLAFA